MRIDKSRETLAYLSIVMRIFCGMVVLLTLIFGVQQGIEHRELSKRVEQILLVSGGQISAMERGTKSSDRFQRGARVVPRARTLHLDELLTYGHGKFDPVAVVDDISKKLGKPDWFLAEMQLALLTEEQREMIRQEVLSRPHGPNTTFLWRTLGIDESDRGAQIEDILAGTGRRQGMGWRFASWVKENPEEARVWMEDPANTERLQRRGLNDYPMRSFAYNYVVHYVNHSPQGAIDYYHGLPDELRPSWVGTHLAKSLITTGNFDEAVDFFGQLPTDVQRDQVMKDLRKLLGQRKIGQEAFDDLSEQFGRIMNDLSE